MNIPFFTDYLMLSNPLSIGIIAVFVLALIGYLCVATQRYIFW